MEPSAVTQPSPYQSKEPSLIGRFAELSRLETALIEAQEGHKTLVALASQSGMGKTRLLSDFALAAEARGARIFSGTGMALAGTRPFHAFRSIVQQLLQEYANDRAFIDLLRRQLSYSADILISAAPEFQTMFPEIVGRDAGPEVAGEDRIARALARFLTALGSSDKTAVILLDDCQWMDDATIKVIRLWHELREHESRTLVIAAFRQDEIETSHLLRSLAPEHELALRPLSQSEVSSLISEIAGAITPDALAVVQRLTGGAPFMVLTVFRGLVESNVLQPRDGKWDLSSTEAHQELSSLNQPTIFLRKRFEILDSALLELLECAAILGKEFELRLVAQLFNSERTDLRNFFQEAEFRCILTAVNEGKAAFVHDKLRETLLDMIPAERRATLHAGAAKIIADDAPDRVFDISFHFAQAQNFTAAFPFALRAAQQAHACHSLLVAEEQYRIALRGSAAETRSSRSRIYEGLGRVLFSRGRYEESETQLLVALDLADDEVTKARIYEQLGELKTHSSDLPNGMRYIESGLRLLGEKPASGLARIALQTLRELIVQTAHTLWPRAFLGRRAFKDRERELLIHRLYLMYQYFAFFECKIPEVLPVHLRSLNRLENYPPTRELAHLYAGHETFCSAIPWFSRAFAYSERGLKIARDSGDLWMQGLVLMLKGSGLYIAARYREGLDALYRGQELLDRAGDRWESNIGGCNIAYCLYRLGNVSASIDTARRVTEEAFAIGNYVPGASALSCWSKVSGGQVPDDIILSALAKTPQLDVQSSVEIKQAAAVWHLGRGETARAIELLREAWSQFRAKHLSQEYVISTLPWLITALRRRIGELPDTDQVQRRALEKEAWHVYRKAIGLMKRFRASLPHIYREAGMLCALHPKKRAEAREYLYKSLREAERQEALYAAAEARLAIGAVGGPAGWPEASELLARGRSELERLGANTKFHVV